MICVRITWRSCHPQILTDLCSNLKLRKFRTGKYKVRRNRNLIFFRVIFQIIFVYIVRIIHVKLIQEIILFKIKPILSIFPGIHILQLLFSEKPYLNFRILFCICTAVVFPFQQNLSIHIFSRGKITSLIKFIIIGNIHLWHKTHNFSTVQRCRRIIKLSLVFQRQPHKNKSVYILCLSCNTKKLRLCFFQKCFLPEKIPTGIACNAQLREHHDHCSLFCHLMYHTDNLSGIIFTVRYPHIRCSCTDFNKSVFHIFPFPVRIQRTPGVSYQPDSFAICTF